MDVTYKVHAVRATERSAQVDFQGTPVTAVISLLEVELIDESGKHGTINLRMHTLEERQYGADNFKEGDEWVVTFAQK